MRVSRLTSLCVRVLVLVSLVGLIAAVPAFAQQAPPPAPSASAAQAAVPVIHQNNTDYAKPKNPWTVIGSYTGRNVTAPVLTNTPRIEQLMQGGKIMLSLNDAIALALENNLDLAIARYNLDIAETDILRAKSGGATRGVNTGLVTGTPGGGGTGSTASSGGGAGGTTTGAGGAGTGTGGIVSSTTGAGPSIDSFDPILTGNFQIEHANYAQSNAVTSGVLSLSQNTGLANFGYSQGFQTGTLLNVTFNNSRSTTNGRTNLMPTINSSFRAAVRQHLLAGCCLFVNRRNILTANNNMKISNIAFENQVISTVSQIQNIYWDLVNAYEDYKVKERSLALAQKTLSDNQKQVEIGTLAPIEITRAQSEVSTREQDLIISQTNLQLQQLLMKNAVTRNLSNPDLATAPVVPTDTMAVTDEPMRPIQELVNEALQRRPDINSQRIDLQNREISKKAVRNALRPTLDLVGFYGGSGLTGNPQVCTQADATSPLVCVPDITRPTRGYGGAFGDLFDSTNPDKGVALQLTIPIRNRSAQADQARSELEYRQAEMRLAQLQNEINIEVRNAQYAVTQNRARVDAARKARDLAVESLNAEQKKYALGASTNTLVLQAQRDLTQAEVNVVAAMAAYEKSRVSLDQVTGYTLDRLGIKLDDAANATVKQMPNVPGVTTAPSTVTAQPIQK